MADFNNIGSSKGEAEVGGSLCVWRGGIGCLFEDYGGILVRFGKGSGFMGDV